MRKMFHFIVTIALLLTVTACKSKNVNITTQDVLSYNQYVKILSSTKDQLHFTSVPMKLSESTLDNPTIIMVNKAIAFGKKINLTLNDEARDSTQHFLTYEDEKNGYKVITGWIYTNSNQGSNLLYLKPDIQGNTGDFNSILSYKNILIHVQLTRLFPSSPSPGDYVRENEAVLKDIVNFLETKAPTLADKSGE
ncbi:hypothetical protein [Paenibacillus glufosinatiresistens]|uniref:hypothetical protein n=1 Tax=Paenibacillus glufosinatiresistens TaxID=3070657 RepID=UPI00286E3645|nr:hypothetical protein [Paenibacillus sp. YX.27]